MRAGHCAPEELSEAGQELSASLFDPAEDARAALVFAVMQLNRTAHDESYENKYDFFRVIKSADFRCLPAGALVADSRELRERLYIILAGSAVSAPAGGKPSVFEKGALIGLEQFSGAEPFASAISAGKEGISLLAVSRHCLLKNPAVYRGLLGRGLGICGKTCLYELGKKLGVGAAGPVFEIIDQKLCAKIYFEENGRQLSAQLPEPPGEQPDIIGIHEIISAHGAQFVIMDMARGITVRDGSGAAVLCRNLRQMLDVFCRAGRSLSIDMAARVFRHIARGLLCVHARGSVHRSIKPEHIFIDIDSANEISFKLSDCSLAFPLGPGLDRFLGGAHYRPPEFFAGGAAPTGSADMYSLGAVCYELLTGRTLFEGANVLELARRHLEQQPDMSLLPAGTPLWLGITVEQCLKKNPAERPCMRDVEKLLAATKNPQH